MDSVIYLDSPASTRLDPAVRAAMQQDAPGNPHAVHAWGAQARQRIERAKQQVLSLAGPGELVFTSGATEANALAILGMALRELRLGGQRRTILTCATEHASVLELKSLLAHWGFQLRALPVQRTGRLDPEALNEALGPDVLMLSLMTVNNETGVTQDWEALSACAGRLTVHTDAAQAVGKVACLPARADLITLSAHKMYGPQGIGALLIRRGPKPDAWLRGGGQQQGLRSGTLPTALCIGFGASCQVMHARGEEDRRHIRHLGRSLAQGIADIWPGATRIGTDGHCVDGILCMQLPGATARAVLGAMPNVAAATGSACAERNDKISHVLKAMRVRNARACLRLGVSRLTSASDIERFLVQLDSVRAQLAP